MVADETVELVFDEALLQIGPDEIVRPVYTKPLHEFRLRQFCQENGIACYLPLQKAFRMARHIVNGRSYSYPKEVLKPMFSGYLFVKFNKEERAEVFRSDSVLRILTVKEGALEKFLDEIRLIRRLEAIAMTQPLDFNASIREGDKFVIESGVWQGVTGYLKKKSHHFKWVVEIESIGGLVSATIDPSKYKMTRIE